MICSVDVKNCNTKNRPNFKHLSREKYDFKMITYFLCFLFQGHFNEECKFKEKLLPNNYNAYESTAYPGMYIGLSKTGKTKKGNRVSPAMTVTHFLPRI